MSNVDIVLNVSESVCISFYRFCEGLSALGVLEKIRMHPESFWPLFCHVPSALTADRMEDIFSISLSPEGSNKRSAEEMVVTFWRDFLQDSQFNLSVYLSGYLVLN